MKKLSFVLIFGLFINPIYAQKKLIAKLFSNEKDTTRKASYIPIPVFGYAQETGFEFGLGSIYSFYIDKQDNNNRSSNMTGSASYSTKESYNVKLSSDLWTKENKYHIINEIRFKDLPFNFYGVGNQTLQSDEDKIKQRFFKFSLDIERKIANNTYTGISLGFEKYNYKDLAVGGILDTSPLVLGKNGGKVLYIGLSQSYDTRNSNNYPTQGFFGRISYQYAPNLFGSNSFSGSQVKLNLRGYWSLAPSLTLGLQGLYYTIQGKNTPFYLLQQLGNDEIMRGYYTGRYRDKNLIASQAELRYRFVERLGVVAFGGLGKVFSNGRPLFYDLKPNYGIGGRFFFDPAKGLSVRADYGIGEKLSNEKRQTGFYISFAEAF